ncbi:MAG: ABC transporter permease [Marinilabiliales bacterium]
MKGFTGFLKKEFLHIFRDKRTMLILFGMPIVQILLFGYVVNNDIKNIPVAIYAPKYDEVIYKITNKLEACDFFTITLLNSNNDIDKILRSGKAKEVVVFESDFGKKLIKNNNAKVQLIADASDANTANLVVSYTKAIIGTYFKEISALKPPLEIITESRMLYNPGLKGAYMFVPGTMALILMLISAMMTSISIAREKEMGTMEVLLISPLKPTHIIIGKVLPYVMLAFINASSIIILGNLVFGVPIKGSIILLMFESILFILLALSLGVLISTIAKTQQVAMFVSMLALLLPTILLSGFIFPIENMPKILQYLSYIIPPKYFIIILKNIMLKGTGITFIWKETLILSGFIVLFIVVSIKKFNIRLDI